MNIDPLFEASHPIPAHAIIAISAFFLGGIQLVLPKGIILHRLGGYLWCIAMIVVAFTGFFIHGYRVWGLFSPIHGLSVWTIFAVVWAVWSARRGDIRRHRIIMISTYLGALVIAGAATLLPGRIFHSIFFG